jgi:hypothetical protein
LRVAVVMIVTIMLTITTNSRTIVDAGTEEFLH